jgi:hypothetical protein
MGVTQLKSSTYGISNLEYQPYVINVHSNTLVFFFQAIHPQGIDFHYHGITKNTSSLLHHGISTSCSQSAFEHSVLCELLGKNNVCVCRWELRVVVSFTEVQF